MTYHIDRTAQLADASAKGYGALKASLQAQGVPTKQHNLKSTKKSAAKKAASPAKKSAPAAKKATKASKPAAAKKAAKKS